MLIGFLYIRSYKKGESLSSESINIRKFLIKYFNYCFLKLNTSQIINYYLISTNLINQLCQDPIRTLHISLALTH